jgi:hypothetical protein
VSVREAGRQAGGKGQLGLVVGGWVDQPARIMAWAVLLVPPPPPPPQVVSTVCMPGTIKDPRRYTFTWCKVLHEKGEETVPGPAAALGRQAVVPTEGARGVG